VVGDLEHVRLHSSGLAEQPSLRLLLLVAEQQDADAPDAHEQHDAGVVGR
jgi:hypothetical protein